MRFSLRLPRICQRVRDLVSQRFQVFPKPQPSLDPWQQLVDKVLPQLVYEVAGALRGGCYASILGP